MEKFLSNKKGGAPVFILVIGVVAICILALFSFISFEIKGPSKEIGLEAFEGISSDVESFEFYLNVGFSEEESLKKMVYFQKDAISKMRSRGGDLEAEIDGENLVIKRKSNNLEVTYYYSLD